MATRSRRSIAAARIAGVASLAAAVAVAAVASTAGAASSPPLGTRAPAILAVAHAGWKLTADPGAWRGARPISFAYEWLS